MPTLGEFLSVAQARGVIVGTSTSTVTSPKGEIRFRYAQRRKGDPLVILSDDDSERLTPTVLSYLCRQLGIEPREFGLDLGALES
jgi:hypothetical protein